MAHQWRVPLAPPRGDDLKSETAMERLSAFLTLVVALAFALAPAVTNPFSGFEADQLPIPQIDPPIQPAG